MKKAEDLPLCPPIEEYLFLLQKYADIKHKIQGKPIKMVLFGDIYCKQH